jgi:membrane-bound lytic murein transglycosylase D
MSIHPSSTRTSIGALILSLALMSGDIAFSAEPSELGRASVVDMSLEPPGTKSITETHPGTAEPDIDNNNLDERARPADLWERIRNGFAMAELDSPEVRDNEDFYANRPQHLKRIIERSRRYLFHIVEEVERRGMPAEIALLPIIESAFNPAAYSHRHAAGIWQLIPITGTTYGLKQNWWYDERRDIIGATRAALDYLQNLHGMFGDWELALASYNWGEGAVARALAKNRNKGLPTNFRNMKLPPETRNYIPRLIAIKNIVSNPAAFGIELEPLPNERYFEQVPAKRHIDVRLAAWLADISVDEFKALNPGHNRPVINTDGLDALLIPVDKVEIFAENLRNHDQPFVSWQVYRTRNGDTTEMISKRYGISPRKLREVNDIGRYGDVMPGQPLLVPGNGSGAGVDDISMMTSKPARRGLVERHFIHLVRGADTFHGIARRYRVTVEQIMSWNGNLKYIVIGQKLILKLPAPAGTIPSAPANRSTSQKKRA